MVGFVIICAIFCLMAAFIEWCLFKNSDFWEKKLKAYKERKIQMNAKKNQNDFTNIMQNPPQGFNPTIMPD